MFQFSLTDQPPVGFYFVVTFFVGGVLPNPLDIRFRKVSGISAKVETTSLKEGGENLYTHRMPVRIEYQNLVLERGMVIGSPLNIEFNAAMSLFKFYPGNVLVCLLNENDIPVSSWVFMKAYPVRWSVSDLDAGSNNVAIDTMELAYTRFQSVRI